MRKMLSKARAKRVRSITWSCPRCGRPFLTQTERDLHYLQCGS